MEWKAAGFRISQLGEAVSMTAGPSAVILRPDRVQGFNGGGDTLYLDFARAETVLTPEGWEWQVTTFAPIPETVRRYLVDVLNFPEEWLSSEYADFKLDEYEPANNYAGEKMHYGFRIVVAPCNSLTVVNGAAETNKSGTVAYLPWWRDAFFGYTKPATATFRFWINSSKDDVIVEDLGTWQHVNGDDIEGWEHYPGLIPPRQATNEPGNTTLKSDCFVLTGGLCYYPMRNNPSGWESTTEVRTVTGRDGKTYVYLWASPDPYGFRWAEVVDPAIPFTFDDDFETKPEILIEANRIRIENLRSIRTFRITADLAGIEAANQWTPTEAQWDIIHDAVRAAENGGEMSDFDSRKGQEFVLGGYVFATDLKVIPSSTFYEEGHNDLPDGVWVDAVTEPDITRVQLVTEERIEVHCTAADIHHRVTIPNATCKWERTDKHEINFTEAAPVNYMTSSIRFNGDNQLPSIGSISASAFVATYGKGANADEPGSFSGDIVVSSTVHEDYSLASYVQNGCDRSWSIEYVK